MKSRVVSFRCVLRNKLGQVLSSSFNREVLTHLESELRLKTKEGESPAPRALAEAIGKLKTGQKKKIFVPAGEAYGFYNSELVVNVLRKHLVSQKQLALGVQVITEAPDGSSHFFRVVEMSRDYVTLDGNHPFAGQDLIFELEATEVREASPEEIREELQDDNQENQDKRGSAGQTLH
jgi:FKBP-type peptidyl-prolyl cis-trans isomerase SlyD